jgi:hypothetical protein
MSPTYNQPIADRLHSECRADYEAPAAARGSR